MPVQYSYRGRVITPEDILLLRQFIAEHSQLSRRKLSAKVCEAWDWRQANGALRDMVCRGLLLMLHRAGEIQLPEVRFVPRNPLVDREQPAPVLIDTTPVIAHGCGSFAIEAKAQFFKQIDGVLSLPAARIRGDIDTPAGYLLHPR
jgi:hypothetical protein